MNKVCEDFIKAKEKKVLVPYMDRKGGKPTIGYGNTFYEDGTPVKMTDPPLTNARAIQLFSRILSAFETEVRKNVTAKVNSNQLGMLTSLAYNIGAPAFAKSSLLKMVNKNPNDPLITAKFAEWRNDGGKVVQGLVIRRAEESKIYFSPVVSDGNNTLKKFILPLVLFFYTVFMITL